MADANEYGYCAFQLGGFNFTRDEYFAHIAWPGGSHITAVDAFLRALMRDVSWNFFYGIVNFDEVFGTLNHYGTVDVFAGLYNAGYKGQKKEFVQNFPGDEVRGVFPATHNDWTNQGSDPFAAPAETGSAFGPKRGNNTAAVTRERVTA